jgi:hypothetical protein
MAEVMAIGGDAGSDLRGDGLVATQEREVAVCRGGGDNLDVPGVLQAAKRSDEIPLVAHQEVIRDSPIEVGPRTGQVLGVTISAGSEVLAVPFREPRSLFEVPEEPVPKSPGGQGLGEHGGDAHRDSRAMPFASQAIHHPQNRDVALRGGFVEPVLAVGPAAVPQNPREMAMENEHDRSDRFVDQGLTRQAPSSRQVQPGQHATVRESLCVHLIRGRSMWRGIP